MKDTDMNNSRHPRHVAIIMDGNGRWAARRGLPRTAGHKQGAEALRRTVKAAGELGIEYMTVFGFSSENRNRPEQEVGELMRLLRRYLRSETMELHAHGVRLIVIGDREGLDKDIVELIGNAESITRANTKLTLIIALNYGGRDEILRAAYRSAQQGQGLGFAEFSKIFDQNLMTAGLPDPDLLIRTSGELRISNFLLWQCAYAEFLFTDTPWPDFGKEDLEKALADYARRDRRFGLVRHQARGG